MPLDDFLGVLDEIAATCNPAKIVIAVTGGEPLLRPDLEQCGTEFQRRGFPWGMVSNGYALTDQRLASLLECGLRSLTISLDGLEQSHNWLRAKEDSFQKAVKGIEAATRAHPLTFDVITCVNQRNLSELHDIKGLLHDLGVRRWRLVTIFPKGRARGIESLAVSGGQLRHLLNFIKSARNEGTINTRYGCEGFLGPYEGEVRPGLFWCRAGTNIGSVLVDGSISACPSLRGDFIQGNIHEDSFMECWRERFGVMRDRSWTRVGACADCSSYTWCEGDGLHLRDGSGGGLSCCHLRMLMEQDSGPA